MVLYVSLNVPRKLLIACLSLSQLPLRCHSRGIEQAVGNSLTPARPCGAVRGRAGARRTKGCVGVPPSPPRLLCAPHDTVMYGVEDPIADQITSDTRLNKRTHQVASPSPALPNQCASAPPPPPPTALFIGAAAALKRGSWGRYTGPATQVASAAWELWSCAPAHAPKPLPHTRQFTSLHTSESPVPPPTPRTPIKPITPCTHVAPTLCQQPASHLANTNGPLLPDSVPERVLRFSPGAQSAFGKENCCRGVGPEGRVRGRTAGAMDRGWAAGSGYWSPAHRPSVCEGSSCDIERADTFTLPKRPPKHHVSHTMQHIPYSESTSNCMPHVSLTVLVPRVLKRGKSNQMTRAACSSQSTFSSTSRKTWLPLRRTGSATMHSTQTIATTRTCS